MTTPPNPIPTISPEAPGAPPSIQKSNMLAWVLGGCGTVLVLFIIAAVLGARLFLKNNVQVGPDGSMNVKIPGGATMHTGKAKDIGIPVYPGTSGNGTSVDMTMPGQKQSITMVTYVTTDPVDKVDAWYSDNLNNDYVRQGPGRKRNIMGDKVFPVPVEDQAIEFSVVRSDSMMVVKINEFARSTQITLMRTNATAAQ
ncbi:MAG TPA: hypothetical protein VGZ48_13660 [Candidatus Acidoferrales bacterium]|jgi:hypothetical protein|nr:hypothetical protein [Candidatus Acidoferrales bacterium]